MSIVDETTRENKKKLSVPLYDLKDFSHHLELYETQMISKGNIKILKIVDVFVFFNEDS